MRVTVDTGPYCQPYLDGQPVKCAIEADDVEGYVKHYKTDSNGRILVDHSKPDDPLTVIESRGVVTLECKASSCTGCPGIEGCTMRRPGR